MINYLNDTNIFESKTGVLNLAPLKVSGNYKIVVDKNNNLYFDNYIDRRVLINKNQRFLPQLSNFLSVETNIKHNEIIDKLKYGSYRDNQKLCYHTTLYFNDNDYPEYFLINKINYNSNNNLTKDFDFNKNSKVLSFINLKEIGLTNIFEEINNLSLNYPLYLDFDNSKCTIFGFDYIQNTSVKKEINLLYHLANQNDFGVINNFIINSFIENKIIYPRFLNIEFEFDNDDSINLFDNFFGYYTNTKLIESINDLKIIDDKKDYINQLHIISKEQIIDDRLIQYKLYNKNQIKFDEKYNSLKFGLSFLNSSDNNLFARLKFNNIFEDDVITIYDEFNNIFFEYLVKIDDLENKSFKETLQIICDNIYKLSNKQIQCYLDNNLINTINFVINSSFNEFGSLHFKLSKNKNYEFIDYINTSENIYLNESEDIKLYFVNTISSDLIISKFFTDINDLNYQNISKIKLDNKFYDIDKIFRYKNDYIIRLFNDDIFQNNFISLYSENYFKNYIHIPILFLNYINDDIVQETQEQFNFYEYVLELNKFIDENNTQEKNILISETIDDFGKTVILEPKSFISETFESTNSIYNKNSYSNVDNVLNIKFNFGFNSFFGNNLLNFDYRFYNNNANTNLFKYTLDDLKFHWFLIKSDLPNYFNNNNHSLSKLRYFKNKPMITSKLINTGNHCETVFLGVKYKLPKKYNNYSFSVYLEPNKLNDNVLNNDIPYYVEIDNQNKTIYLVINKYLDFIDLIRGGNKNNDSFLDLSFFYTINKSYNTLSDLVFNFKDGGLLLCDDTKPVNYDTVYNLYDWKIPVYKSNNKPLENNIQFNPELHKYLICLKKPENDESFNLKELLPNSGDYKFFIYSTIKINNKNIDYVSIQIILKDIIIVNENFVWCNDIKIIFYDTNKLLVYENYELNDDIKILTTDINDTNDYYLINNSDSIDINKYITLINVNNQQLKVINSFNKFSFKDEYWEEIVNEKLINQSNTYNNNYQKFDLINGYKNIDINEIDNFEDKFLNKFDKQKISLFQRNQLWYLLKELMITELKFKNLSEKQVQNYINELLLNNLYEYTNINDLQIINENNKFIKINVEPLSNNLVVWKINDNKNLVKINRHSGPYSFCFDKIDNVYDFQIKKENDLSNNYFKNIFDKNYGNKLLNHLIKKEINNLNYVNNLIDYDINSIGLWNELTGNFISSLFVKNNDIIITIKKSWKNEYNFIDLITISENIDINENLYDLLTYNNFIDSNDKYLKTIDKNINEYILKNGFKWLLNFYEFKEIYDIDNNKIDFDINIDNELLLIKNHRNNGYYKIFLKRK